MEGCKGKDGRVEGRKDGWIDVDFSKLTWKWRGASDKPTIIYKTPSRSFHVNLGEGNQIDGVLGSPIYAKLPRQRESLGSYLPGRH